MAKAEASSKETCRLRKAELLHFHVALVADQDAGDVVGGVFLDLVHPVLDGAEALTVGDVVGHDDAVGSLVVAGCDSLEAFLSSCVPNL